MAQKQQRTDRLKVIEKMHPVSIGVIPFTEDGTPVMLKQNASANPGLKKKRSEVTVLYDEEREAKKLTAKSVRHLLMIDLPV